MGYYEEKRASARKQIAKRGTTVEFVVQGGTFDKAQGKYVGGTETKYATVGVLYPVKESSRDSNTPTSKKYFEAIVAAEDSNGVPLQIVPEVSMRMDFGGVSYQIMEVEPLRPGGVDVLYTIRVVL